MKDSYEDIIELPHHVSPNRPRMSISDRAAQFAPFSALTGYGEVVTEVARETKKKIMLDDYEIEAIDLELKYALENIKNKPFAHVKYFSPDKHKEGGDYLHACGIVVSVNEFDKNISFADGLVIDFDNIISIQVSKDDDKYED